MPYPPSKREYPATLVKGANEKVTSLRVLEWWETDHVTNHIYQNHLEQVEELLAREPLPLPKLGILDESERLRGLNALLTMRYENLKLMGYQSHGKIAATVAV